MKANRLIWAMLLGGMAAVKLPGQTIVTQPTNQVVSLGGNATFSVAVTGNGPFAYQWQFNGTNLPPNGNITTVAGIGTTSFSGDGGAATNAGLYYPYGIAVENGGNLIIADLGNNRIRKVTTNGIITTVAGNGTQGYSGDGGAATNAMLYFPSGVTIDACGNLIFADLGNNRIRKVTTNSIITTIAGGNNKVFFGDGGAATNAGLFQPRGVAVDTGGDLFIADTGNERIRKVDPNGIITTVAGNGTASFSGDGGAATNATLNNPDLIEVDAGSNLFIADYYNSRVRKVDTSGIITTMAGNDTAQGYSGDGGAATNAGLVGPKGVVLDFVGNLFIADSSDNRIRRVDTSGIIATVAGNGTPGYSGDGGAATSAMLYYPVGVAVDYGGNLFIADGQNNRIRKVQVNSPTLILNSVSTNNAGNYSVIITGSGGSVTSSNVTLTVVTSPYITSQPQPLTVTNGHAASFVVTAIGNPSLAYQWQFSGSNLNGATNTTLTLQNAFTANAGAYTVAITNTYGSVTSNPAILTVLPLCITAPTMLASGQFQFSFDTATGVNYAVQYSTNLTQWFPFVTLGGVDVPLTLTDPNTAGSQQRFYRISLSPQ
jgi:sugar lactone lactonase YvrE